MAKDILLCVADYALSLYASPGWEKEQFSELKRLLSEAAGRVVDKAATEEKIAYYDLYVKDKPLKIAAVEQRCIYQARSKLLRKVAMEITK